MNSSRIAAIVLVVLGVQAVVYGGFSDASETHEATLGPVSMYVDERAHGDIPVWACAGANLIGGKLLFFGSAKR